MKLSAIHYIRFQRQHLLQRADESSYEALFRNMSPVPTKHWIEPGTAPQIEYRADFDDVYHNDLLRSNRTIIKGRFQGGNVGYIYADELPLFMSAYKKDFKGMNAVDEQVYNTLRQEGPMNIGMIKELTGLLSKQISPALQKMQKSFILYEDQVDKDNDRAWYILEDEFYDQDLNAYTSEQAMDEIIRRFAYLNVFIDEMMVKSYTKLTNKAIQSAIQRMTDAGTLTSVEFDGQSGYVLTDDLATIDACTDTLPDTIYVLDLNDYLVKSHEVQLKKSYGQKPYLTIQYIMKQGIFIGAVLGHFRFGPHDVEEIQLSISDDEAMAFKESILQAVQKVHPHSVIQRYCGQDLTK